MRHSGTTNYSVASGSIDEEKRRDLLIRSLETNVFFLEPAFALAAARYRGDSRRLRFFLVWEVSNAGTRGALLGLCAVQLPALSARILFAALDA
jgi:hypothetical protein